MVTNIKPSNKGVKLFHKVTDNNTIEVMDIIIEQIDLYNGLNLDIKLCKIQKG